MASAHSSLSHIDHTDTQHLASSPLNIAAFRGDVSRVRQRLSEGDNVDAVCHLDIDGRLSLMTPLYCAVLKRHNKVAHILLQAGANPSAVNPGDSMSVLYMAAFKGNLEGVTMLLKAGAVVDWTDHINRTPLFVAALCGHDKIIEALLAAHATVDHECCDGQTPLVTLLTATGCFSTFLSFLLR